MSNRPEITTVLSISTEKYITPHGDPRIYWAKEVTFDYATSNAVRAVSYTHLTLPTTERV